MLKIKLARIGAKKQPKYRLIVSEARSKRNGDYKDLLGTYDPMSEPAKIDVKMERYDYWVSVGAQPTPAVASIVKRVSNRTKKASK
jgi:small subunit ribosomal protein S16